MVTTELVNMLEILAYERMTSDLSGSDKSPEEWSEKWKHDIQKDLLATRLPLIYPNYATKLGKQTHSFIMANAGRGPDKPEEEEEDDEGDELAENELFASMKQALDDLTATIKGRNISMVKDIIPIVLIALEAQPTYAEHWQDTVMAFLIAVTGDDDKAEKFWKKFMMPAIQEDWDRIYNVDLEEEDEVPKKSSPKKSSPKKASPKKTSTNKTTLITNLYQDLMTVDLHKVKWINFPLGDTDALIKLTSKPPKPAKHTKWKEITGCAKKGQVSPNITIKYGCSLDKSKDIVFVKQFKNMHHLAKRLQDGSVSFKNFFKLMNVVYTLADRAHGTLVNENLVVDILHFKIV